MRTAWLKSGLMIGAMCASSACGLGILDNEAGGDDNLPTRGAGPYGKPDVDFDTSADEPYLIEFNRAHATDPSALWRDDGGVRVWFGYESIDPGSLSEIWYAEVPAVTALPDLAPAKALGADQAWEQNRVAAPSVVAIGEDHLVMYYEGGDANRAVGRADSLDGGQSWTKFAGNPVLLDAVHPAAGLLEGRTYLYAERPSQPGIFVAQAEDGLAFSRRDAAVLLARGNDAEAFDRDGVGQPFFLPTERDGAQAHFGLFFVGTSQTSDGPEAAIGYAGSFDGERFSRFGDGTPVLSPGLPAETGPTVLVTSASGTMLYAQERRGTQRIAVALHE